MPDFQKNRSKIYHNSHSDSEQELFENSESDYNPSTSESESESGASLTNNVTKLKFKKNNMQLVEDHVRLNDDTNKITLKKVKKDDNGRIERNKKHCCQFCHKLVSLLPRHLESMHSDEIDVAKLLAMPKNSASRWNGFIEISRIGDFYHNCEVVAKQSGELILVRRPGPEEDFAYKRYSPCPYCLGFMMKRHLWHHVKYSCTSGKAPKNLANADKVHRRILVESRSLLAGSLSSDMSKSFVENILNHMREDIITDIVKQDDVILKFGQLHFEKYGLTQIELTRQCMRQLGRLLKTLQSQDMKTEGDKTKLSSWLHPTNFDDIIMAVKIVCSQDISKGPTLRPEFKIPSLALKLGHHLRKCIGIEQGKALRQCSRERNEQLKDLLNLINLEWSVKISSNALSTLNCRTFNKTKLLPITSDIVKLNNYLMREVKKVNENKFDWRRLLELTLCQIILFNKRRSGEVARLSVETYQSRSTCTGTEEIVSNMTELEKKLANRLGVIETRGKRERKVHILLTPEVQINLENLLLHRKEAGVSEENPFFFARLGGSTNHLRGHDCLKQIALEAQLQNPSVITSTNLRKYIATVIQMFNLTENETDWMARHLGHDIRVHREFYRTHESVVETTKISRILLAVDQGKAHIYKGKKLEDIDVDVLEYTDESESDVDLDSQDNVIAKGRQIDDNFDCPANTSECNNDNKFQQRPLISKKRSEDALDTDNDDGNNFQQEFPASSKIIKDHSTNQTGQVKLPTSRKRKQKVQMERRPWSCEEKTAVLNYYRNNIPKSILPKKTDAELCLQENSLILSKRSWKDIKNFVYNYICKIKKGVK